MNVLIVSDTYPPDINGVARTLEMLAQGLARLGHRVDVLTTSRGAGVRSAAQEVRVRSVRSVRLPGYHEVRTGLVGARRLRALMEALKADVVYVAVETLMGLNAMRAARSLDIPVVAGFHTNFHSYADHYGVPFMKRMAERFLRWFHNLASRTLAPSHDTAGQLRALGVNSVGVVGRGVDTWLFAPAWRDSVLRREWGAADFAPVVAFVGRIAAEKNLPLAVKAMTRLMEKIPGTRGVFVGDGPKSRSLRQRHPEFIHAGERVGADLARHYASADMFLFTSLTETYGNVLPEAMSSGLVTVSFDYAAAHELVEHGWNGFTAPLPGEAAFLAAVDEAAVRWNDATIRRAARETAQTLSWSAVITEFEGELMRAGRVCNSPVSLPAPGLAPSP
jgi:glycosyltransferase involved in cell wall biosynthesis